MNHLSIYLSRYSFSLFLSSRNEARNAHKTISKKKLFRSNFGYCMTFIFSHGNEVAISCVTRGPS